VTSRQSSTARVFLGLHRTADRNVVRLQARAGYVVYGARDPEVEYRLFSILTEQLSATADIIGRGRYADLLVALASSFPVGSLMHVIAVRYILGRSLVVD
jgi:hypothetical protein